MYRYILRESCSQFDSLPLTSLTILPARLALGSADQFAHVAQGELAVVGILSLAAGLCAIGFAVAIAYPSLVRVVQRQRSGVLPGACVLLCTVTFYANRAHNLTRSP